MIDVIIIDKENTIARFINEPIAKVTIYEDEVRALNALEHSKPALIIVNHTINRAEIAAYISILFKSSHQSPIILVGSELSDEDILDCLESGSRGYLPLNDVEKFINKLISAVIDGEAWISRRLVSKLLERLNSRKVMESAK